MLEKELREIVLAVYYQYRKDDFIKITPAHIDAFDIEQVEIYRISQQLHEMGLIEFKPLFGDDTIMDGRGKITAMGVDFAESNYPDARQIPTQPQTIMNISTGGGTYIAGDVNTDRDFVGRDRSAADDCKNL